MLDVIETIQLPVPLEQVPVDPEKYHIIERPGAPGLPPLVVEKEE
jgi:hypothetical protein